MQRLGSCIALLLTLACPVLCQLDSAGSREPEPVQAASCCGSCPGDPQPERDPCGDSSCFCSPYVFHEHRPAEEAISHAWIPSPFDAWTVVSSDRVVKERGRLAALLFSSPPISSAVRQSPPLLI